MKNPLKIHDIGSHDGKIGNGLGRGCEGVLSDGKNQLGAVRGEGRADLRRAAAVGSLHVQMNVFLPEQINQGIGKSLSNGIGGIAVIVLTDADVVGSGVLLWKRII